MPVIIGGKDMIHCKVHVRGAMVLPVSALIVFQLQEIQTVRFSQLR
uniref:Uncharacterized protein n=1 Tax=Arundo donax TaxID=35708 RepID=A0A0A9GD97_ARUDO